MGKTRFFALGLAFMLLLAVLPVVSASDYDYNRYSYNRYNHYSNYDYYDYSKSVHSDPWRRTVEIRSNSPYKSSYYYKSSSTSYYKGSYDYWGYRPVYSDKFYSKYYKTSYHPYTYDKKYGMGCSFIFNSI